MEGYKQTELGLIPEDWEIKSAKEILLNYSLGGNYDNSIESCSGIPLIKMGNIGRGKIDLNKVEYINKGINYEENDILKNGDILFNTRNTLDLVGKVAIWKNELPFALYNSNLLRLNFKKEYIGNNEFVNYLFNSQLILNKLRGYATGTTSVAAIYTKDLLKIKFPLPPIEEQKAIADCLSTWDQAIEKQEQLIKSKERRHKALMQKLLSGKQRLLGFSEDWNFIRFREFYTESKNKLGENKLEVLSVTKNGIVAQSEYFNKEIASSDTTKYLIVEKGDFVVSGLNFWMGSFDVLTNYDIGIVSPAYKVFKLNKGFNNLYFKYLSKSKLMLDAMVGASIIGASIVRRNFDKEILYEWSFKIPSLEEQKEIGKFLEFSLKEIELEKRKVNQLKEQKKALMQKLLIGKVRLPLND